MSAHAPVVVEFVPGTRIHREEEADEGLRPGLTTALRSGPPGTFVLFADGRRTAVPSEQIVASDDAAGRARVSFGGLSFEGVEEGGSLVFWRVQDLLPEEQLGFGSSERLALEADQVAAVWVQGTQVWPGEVS